MHKLTLGLFALTIMASSQVMAASADEIQVYDQAINNIGELNVDVHINYVSSGIKTADYNGEIPAHHSFRVTPEFAYGVNNNFEAGLYVPVLRDADGKWYSELARVRLKYIGDNREHGFYWGLNFELGPSTTRTSEERWNLETRPIFGHISDDWNLTVNPIIGLTLSGNSHVPGFSPAFKVSRKATENTWVSIEHYSDFGDTNQMKSQSQETYLTADTEILGHGVNIGVGHGWIETSNDTTLKAIVNIPL